MHRPAPSNGKTFALDTWRLIVDTIYVQGEHRNGICQLMDAIPRGARSGGFPLIRYLVAKGRYLLSEKVLEFLSEGYFELEDLECSIINGTVEKTESDEFQDSVGNKKYIILGPDTCGYLFYSVGKIQSLDGSRTYVVITGHHAEANYD